MGPIVYAMPPLWAMPHPWPRNNAALLTGGPLPMKILDPPLTGVVVPSRSCFSMSSYNDTPFPCLPRPLPPLSLIFMAVEVAADPLQIC